jgi:signal transduction histidine kinase
VTLHEWLALATCVGQLGLAVLCVARGARGPLAPPLAALSFVMFGWTFAEWAASVSDASAWAILDVTLASLTMPAAMHFILVFVGQRRKLGGLWWAVSVPFFVVAVACLTGLVSEAGARFAASHARGAIQGVLIVPAVGLGFVLLARHARAQGGVEETMRTRLVMAALVVGGTLAAADVFQLVALPVPSTLVTTSLLALVALRFPFFDREPSRLTVVYAFTVAMIAVLGYLFAFRVFAANMAALAFVCAMLTFAFAVVVRRVVAAIGAEKAQMERLAVLGRFSAQMAHDLKNPLTALKGAVQLLQTERAEGRSLDAQGEFVDLMGKEVDRLARLIDRYQQLGRLVPQVRALDVNAVVERVAAMRRMALAAGTSLDVELAQNLPMCAADPDLLSVALDNLVSNAIEAIGGNGRVLLRTRVSAHDAPVVVIEVADDGAGMDARRRERAFDEFFTTKPTGSGLGLPFVKRVAEAHRGTVTLDSREGAGTTARLVLPAVPAAPAH